MKDFAIQYISPEGELNVALVKAWSKDEAVEKFRRQARERASGMIQKHGKRIPKGERIKPSERL